MKKIFVCLLTVFLLLALCGCAQDKLTPSPYQPSDLDRAEGVRAFPEQVSYPVDTQKITVFLENNSGQEIATGISFVLEAKDGEVWRTVPFTQDGDMFHSIAHLIPNGERGEFTVDFSRFDYSLRAGEYRVILTGYGDALPTAYFEITE